VAYDGGRPGVEYEGDLAFAVEDADKGSETRSKPAYTLAQIAGGGVAFRRAIAGVPTDDESGCCGVLHLVSLVGGGHLLA
jgi:hypothetical protein